MKCENCKEIVKDREIYINAKKVCLDCFNKIKVENRRLEK